MHRTDAVDVCRAVRDNKITDIDHAEIDMHGLPEILREFRTGCCPLGRHCERPAITVFYRLRVFLAVLEQPPDPRLLPRIEYGYV